MNSSRLQAFYELIDNLEYVNNLTDSGKKLIQDGVKFLKETDTEKLILRYKLSYIEAYIETTDGINGYDVQKIKQIIHEDVEIGGNER